MVDKLFLIDNNKSRADALEKILVEISSLVIKKTMGDWATEKNLEGAIISQCPEGGKINWLVAHDRNVRNIDVEKYFAHVLTYSAIPTAANILRLEAGNEYEVDVWQEYLNSKSSTLDVFYKPQLKETLVAAYLLLVANEKNSVPLDCMTGKQWGEACEQYKEIGGENDADWSNASEWDNDKIAKVKIKIRDLFSQVASSAMILTPWNIACDANTLRGQLKHSWLENEVLYISIETVINLWQQSRADLATRYAMRVQDLSRLVDSLADGFSPAQLVDTLKPFGGLTAEMKSAIQDTVHAAYLESSGILALQVSLEAAAMGMEAALQKLSRVWALAQPENESKVRTAWKGVREKASALVMELERLPKGGMLP
ncbi:hypothetical protein [Methylobacter sp.]|uniref:hypothetical protein n=1 Tax=Methylobacter sp. TaxID=2051955 RepID=UPI002FDD940F